MRGKGFYVLATAAMLALAAGCGSKEAEEKPQNQVTEAVSLTEAPEATATPEPTVTPAPTATPVPANYMEANGIEVLGAGSHTYQGFKITGRDEKGEYIVESTECESIFEVTQEENGDGTKTISATIHCVPTINENGSWSTSAMGGFVDLKSGKAFLPSADKMEQITLLKQDEKSFELRITMEHKYSSVTYPYYTEMYTVVCPSDYEDAGFYLTGYNQDAETYTERAGLWKKLNYIRHGESDLIVFGVNEGLATVFEEEPVQNPADEVQSDEHCFEKNGLTTKGAGKFTYTGTEVTQRLNAETGATEMASVEIKEVEAEFSVTEEFPGDGTKILKGTFTVIPEMIAEDEVKMVSSLNGVINKRTGKSFGDAANGLAIPYEIEWKGNKTTLLVAREVAYSMEEEATVRITHTVVCPEDYDELVFYWTGKHTEEEPEYEPESDLDLLLFYSEYFGLDALFFE